MMMTWNQERAWPRWVQGGAILFALLSATLTLAAAEVKVTRDVVYTTVAGVEVKLDLAEPGTGDGPFPLIVCIHGGGWQAGDKAGHDGLIREWAGQGYVAAALNYRMMPQFMWPAQIEDVKCAVRYLRSRAKELKIDPARVGAMGESAGGHLALMLGLMDAKDGLEGTGGYAGQSSKVQAVVNYFGPADFTTWHMPPEGDASLKQALGKNCDEMLATLVGTTDRNAPAMRAASPISYVNAGDPPILTFQGTVDTLVPADQSKRLHDALQKAHVTEKLMLLEGQGHGWGGEPLKMTKEQAAAWFGKYLKVKPAGSGGAN